MNIIEYYKKEHHISITLTGLEIEEVKHSLGWRNMNPNKSKSKLLDCLDAVRWLSNENRNRN